MRRVKNIDILSWNSVLNLIIKKGTLRTVDQRFLNCTSCHWIWILLGCVMRKRTLQYLFKLRRTENFTERATYYKFSCVLYANVSIICHLPLTENPITATRFGSYWVLFRLSIFCIPFVRFYIRKSLHNLKMVY